MDKVILLSLLIIMVTAQTLDAAVPPSIELKSKLLCSQCSVCKAGARCPPSEAYPHITAFDNSLIAAALQSDLVPIHDRGVYAVPNVKGGESEGQNAYYGWQSTSGSASGYHRFSNYMDKCSEGASFLAVEHHQVLLRGLSSLASLAQADWKVLAPPKKLDHRGFHFLMNRSTGECLTVYGSRSEKRKVRVTKCELNGSNPFQLFAQRFHYHKAFCCCDLHNN